MATMQQRTIGTRSVSAIGLGGMPMSIEGRPDEKRSIETIHAALDAGVTFIDTANAYHVHADEVGHNEALIAKALREYDGDASNVLVATKGGHIRPGDGTWIVNGNPDYIRGAAEESRRRLGVERIGLYQFHRPDPAVPYADSVQALRDLLDDGVIEMAGISNANPEQIRIAQDVLEGRLVSVQNQFSPRFRSSEPELEVCAEMGLAFLPWSPLGGIGRSGAGAGCPRREPARHHPRLGAREGTARHPDPRRFTAREHPRLGHRCRRRADRGRARATGLAHRFTEIIGGAPPSA
jgi:aryl-alcohol dehydrogenase-like predicted oxidoreductase